MPFVVPQFMDSVWRYCRMAAFMLLAPAFASFVSQIASGALRILEEWCPPYAGFFLYYPSRRTAGACADIFDLENIPIGMTTPKPTRNVAVAGGIQPFSREVAHNHTTRVQAAFVSAVT
jgi:hypothetical protein